MHASMKCEYVMIVRQLMQVSACILHSIAMKAAAVPVAVAKATAAVAVNIMTVHHIELKQQ
jgi:hypothetical protein